MDGDAIYTYREVGKGMKNVQLLIVDRASLEQGKPRLCDVGEQGEIFVRAGGQFHINHENDPDVQIAKDVLFRSR